jgi:hypothetical protein
MEFLGSLNIPVILGWVFSLIAIGVPVFLFLGIYLSGRKEKSKELKADSSDTPKNPFGLNLNRKQAEANNNKALIVKAPTSDKEAQVASIFGAPQPLEAFSMPSVGSRVQMPSFDKTDDEANLPPLSSLAPAPPVLGGQKPKERPAVFRTPVLPPPPKNLR